MNCLLRLLPNCCKRRTPPASTQINELNSPLLSIIRMANNLEYEDIDEEVIKIFQSSSNKEVFNIGRMNMDKDNKAPSIEESLQTVINHHKGLKISLEDSEPSLIDNFSNIGYRKSTEKIEVGFFGKVFGQDNALKSGRIYYLRDIL